MTGTMTGGAAGRFFEAIVGRYDRVYALPAGESRRRMDRVLRELPRAPARVLDLGVGTGRELTALLDAGHTPTGLDASPSMLARCSHRARPVPLVCADFWSAPLPFGDGSFDAVVALHGTLAHPPDASAPRRLVRELGRLVRKGGVFVAEVPSPGWLDRLGDAAGDGERRALRTGSRTCIVEDLVVGVSIEAHVLDEREWREALAPDWNGTALALGEVEWIVVARRA
jgi:SAM-dependent methyltransferase